MLKVQETTTRCDNPAHIHRHHLLPCSHVRGLRETFPAPAPDRSTDRQLAVRSTMPCPPTRGESFPRKPSTSANAGECGEEEHREEEDGGSMRSPRNVPREDLRPMATSSPGSIGSALPLALQRGEHVSLASVPRPVCFCEGILCVYMRARTSSSQRVGLIVLHMHACIIYLRMHGRFAHRFTHFDMT